MATGSPVREYTTEELDAMAAAELPAFEQPAPAAAPGPVRGPAMGPVAQLEADREYTTEELDLLEKSSAPPPPQEFTTEELDMEAARLFDDPSYAPTRDEYFELKATKERLTAEGKLPGTAELAAKAVGGFVVTALDAFNTAVYSPLETASKSAATLQTGVGRAALGAMQLGGWVTEAMRGAPKYRDEETGEFLWVSDGDSRQLQQALDAGRKLRPTTDEDLKDYEFENYIAKKGIDAEYQALGEKTAPTELLTRLVTGRNQQETPNLSQASVIEMGADPFNLLPFGAGFKAIGLSRFGKTVSAQTAGVISKVAGGVADGGDALANRFVDVVTNTTGMTPSTAGNVVKTLTRTSVGGGIAAGASALGAPPEVAATIAGFYPAYKAGIGVLRKIETGAGAAKIILRESADATNGLDQAARAAVLANPSVPQVFKEVLERPSNFVPIESTPARLAAEQALSPQMRGLMGKLANPAIVQSVRGASALAKGAVKGTAINAPFSLLAANAGDDEEAAAMLGAGAAFGALGGGVDRFTGLQQRRQQAAISDVSRMLVDVELAGGDVGKLMSTQTPESLVKLASLQGTFRNGLDFIPLNATDYNANVAANGGAGSAGLFVQAPAGERAKVYINLDAKRQGIEPHEFGHALLASGALDGQQKFAARAWVDKTYGAEGIKARAAEYASNIIRAKNAEAFPEGNFEITPTTLASEIDNLAQGGLARGDMDGLDWARDEIFAETFAKASETMDFNAIRRGAPAGGNFLTFAEGILGAQARALSASGVRIDPQTGAPLEKPADLFAKNPLLATDKALVKQLGTYINNYRQWANNPGHEKPAGVRVAPSGRASDIANNPQVTFYDRGDGIKANAFAIQDPTTGQAILRDQRDLNAEHAKVKAQLKALGGSKLIEPGNPVLGPKKVDGRTTVRGKVLPPQFDFLNGFMPHIRNFARQFEQFGQTGESMQVRYHAIGSGDSGAFRIKNLGNLEAITREVIPFEWQLTKAGNLNAVVLDLTQFRNRAMRAINNRNEALAPFNFEIGQLEADLKVWMDNHRNNLPGENKIGTAKRDAINALVGLATTQNRAKNPLNGAFGPGSAIKQFRLDRVDAAIGTGRTGFHFDYDKANGNLLPEIATPLPDLSRDLPGQATPNAGDMPVKLGNRNFMLRSAGLVSMPGQAFPAYHGTPHKVDRFSTEKIGTGEGAQAYGWGLYFAENKKVADEYRDGLSETEYWEGNNKLTGNRAWAALFLENNNRNKNSALLQARDTIINENAFNEVSKAILDIDINNLQVKGGNLYTVDLDVEPKNLLDWDKPLSEQSDKVKEAVLSLKEAKRYMELQGQLKNLEQAGKLDSPEWNAAVNESRQIREQIGFAPTMSGEELYRAFSQAGSPAGRWGFKNGLPSSGPETASAYFHKVMGIPGIRYLDGGSRNAPKRNLQVKQGTNGWEVFDQGQRIGTYATEDAAKSAVQDAESSPTYNYVVFDENLIKITAENGQPVTPQGQAMPDVTITPDEARRRGLVGPVYHGSPDFKGQKFDPKYRARNTGLSRGGFSFTDNIESAKGYASNKIDSAQSAVDSANDVMRELAVRMDSGLKVEGFADSSELPEFNSSYVDDIESLGDYFDEIANKIPKDLGDRLRAAASKTNDPANPVVVEAFLRNPKVTEINGKKLWVTENPDDIFVSGVTKPPQGQAMPDAVPEFDPQAGAFIVDKGDETSMPVYQQANRGKPAVDNKGEPKFVQVSYDLITAPRIVEYSGPGPEDITKPDFKKFAYDITQKGQQQINAAIDSGAVDSAANSVVKFTQEVMQTPEIAAGMGWYSRMRENLFKVLGEDGREILSQLLGATSAKTPVDENFLQAMDAYEGIQAGRYDANRKSYLEMLALEEKGELTNTIVRRNYTGKVRTMADQLSKDARKMKGKKKALTLAEAQKLRDLVKKSPDDWTMKDRYSIMDLAVGIMPKRSNGKKFNANSMAVLKVISGKWLDNRDSPKTPNFAGNLSGRTVQATIDVWAARFLRETLYADTGKPWRIQPKSEGAVNNQDFALGQVIMARAAKKLDMNPDDLQAVLWFAEKHRWDNRGWTKNQGAEKSSFDTVFNVFFPKNGKPLTFAEASKIFKKSKK